MKRALAPLLLSLVQVFSDEFFPIVPDDIEVTLYAKEPLVRNPCAITFDTRGRLCVGMGPQYRNPRADTPGDSVFILVDANGDGVADSRKEFATGFNSIQGLAWRGNELWVANSPDLTIVRDLNGDDEADEYVRLYTDLGNLEHALHGLNWGPDGKLYMSKGNSKGLTQPPGRIAPRPFRQLWGVDQPELQDFPAPVVFKKGEYRRNYHDPNDDWGREGGILRCDPDGTNLEIVSRGFRNPWDIAFDDTFTWLGTDNDQTLGDKFFSPFFGAHFGWGHPWSFDWSGENHLPTVPASGPLFEGSGAGVTFCGLAGYPEKYRGIFLINDWLRREVYIYRPQWRGALLLPDKERFELFASAGAGRSMESSRGRKFDPVDIELGPDGAIYISSWGREYGLQTQGGEMINEGRIYRFRPKTMTRPPERRGDGSMAELISDLGSHLPAWRVNAQTELIRRGAIDELKTVLQGSETSRALSTWTLWTLGRMKVPDDLFHKFALTLESDFNLRLQSVRILAHRKKMETELRPLLSDSESRIRFETLLAIRQAPKSDWQTDLLELAARETDRLVFYATWGAMSEVFPAEKRKSLLKDDRAGVRLAALLSLMEADLVETETLRGLQSDPDKIVASVASRRLAGKAEAVIRGRPLISQKPALAQKATYETVLSSLAQASPQRGRELFLDTSRAGCIACHSIEEKGNSFAPDLREIGSRADAEFIVRSIIDPDAAITEGFVTHVVGVNSGDEYSGVLLEDSGTQVRLVLANGEPVTIPRTLIRKHETTRSSAMPQNFAEILSARQIADITAFLLSIPEQERKAQFARNQFEAKGRDGAFDLFFGSTHIGTYLYKHNELTRPALINLQTASGIPLTREFPAPETADHRWMHPGLAISFGWLEGQDYWRLKSRVPHSAFIKEPTSEENRLHWAVRNHYLHENGRDLVCVEEASYQFTWNGDGLLLEIDTQFFNDQHSFSFGDQEESGLCVRLHPTLVVRGGSGRITNDRGELNEAGTWGREFDWIDYSGKSGDRRVGILIVPHPENPRRCWAHSRDYGVLVANPFPAQRHESATPFVKTTIPKGERFRLRYSVLLYDTIAGAAFPEE